MNKDLIPIKEIVVKTRISICESCELFRPTIRRCALPPKGCGCLIDTFGKIGKAHMLGQSCPHKKWERVSTEDLIELHNHIVNEEL